MSTSQPLMQIIGSPTAVSSLLTTAYLAFASSNSAYSQVRLRFLNSIGPKVNGLGCLCRKAFLNCTGCSRSSSSYSATASTTGTGVSSTSSGGASSFLPFFPLAPFAFFAAASKSCLRFSAAAATCAFASATLRSKEATSLYAFLCRAARVSSI